MLFTSSFATNHVKIGHLHHNAMNWTNTLASYSMELFLWVHCLGPLVGSVLRWVGFGFCEGGFWVGVSSSPGQNRHPSPTELEPWPTVSSNYRLVDLFLIYLSFVSLWVGVWGKLWVI